jgi:hypothetical protein
MVIDSLVLGICDEFGAGIERVLIAGLKNIDPAAHVSERDGNLPILI